MPQRLIARILSTNAKWGRRFKNTEDILAAIVSREEYDEEEWNQLGFVVLLDYYDKTPWELALQYIHDPTSLTEEEVERLKYEGNFRERELLEQSDLVHSDNPVLCAISARYEVKPDHKNFSLLL